MKNRNWIVWAKAAGILLLWASIVSADIWPIFSSVERLHREVSDLREALEALLEGVTE